MVASVVFGLHALWLAAWLTSGHSVRDFIHISPNFFTGSTASATILHGPVGPDGSPGYDGQFFYYMALDPVRAHYYIDFPSYRYERILYPLAARSMALGRPWLIPYTLVALNLVAITIGTLALAVWLARRGFSPWLASIYGFYPGQLISLQRDVADAPGYALAALAICLRDLAPAWSWVASGLAFGLAGLTRANTAIFPLVFLFTDLLLLTREKTRHPVAWARTLGFGALALLPIAAYKLFLWSWLGHTDVPISYNFTVVPLGGVLYWIKRGVGEPQAPELAAVVVPGVITLGAGVYGLCRRLLTAEVVALVLNVLILLVFVNYHPYEEVISATRVTIGIVLAATVALPALAASGLGRSWFWLSSGFWLSLTPVLLLVPVLQWLLSWR